MVLRLQRNDPRRQQSQRVRFTIPPTETQRRGQNRTALSPLRKHDDGQLLHTIASAAKILNALLGGDYSEKRIRFRIKNGIWTEGNQYFIHGGGDVRSRYFVSISRVLDELGTIER